VLYWAVKIILGSAAVAIVAFVGYVAFLAYIMSPMCENEVVADVSAPSGAARAVVFHRDCGATTKTSTQVSILQGRAALPEDGGNVYVADREGGGAPSVEVRWAGDEALVIRHDRGDRSFT
jgi:hypothetical protein